MNLFIQILTAIIVVASTLRALLQTITSFDSMPVKEAIIAIVKSLWS
jgi:hypothetical protein